MTSRTCLGLLVATLVAAPSGAQVPDLYDINAYRTIYLTFSQSNWWTQLTNNYQSQTEIPATMVVDGVTYTDVGVRFRGNTSYSQLPAGSQKTSFNIRTDSFVPSQDIMGYDHLNLNNGFHDPTFLREFTTYYVMRQYGPAPGCNFVTLYINNEYWGVYINVQQPNKDFVRQWWRSNDGNRYRGFPTTGNFQNGRTALTWLGNNPASYLAAYQAKQGDGTDLMLCCNLLNNTASGQLQAVLPTIFSVDQFYRYAAVMNIMLQVDSYLQSGKDHYLYHDEVYGQFHMFPFDVNESLGSEGGNATTNMWQYTTNPDRPAFTQTLQFPSWRNRYIAHYRNIAESTMSWSVLGPFLTQYHTMIAADVAADTKKIYTTAQFNQNLTQNVTVPGGGGGPFGGGSNTVAGLQPLIQSREAFLSTHPDLTTPQATLTNLQHLPASPMPNQPVTITVEAAGPVSTVSLWSRDAGPFTSMAMFDDGLHGDGAAGDGVWGVILPAFAPGVLLDYYAEAATATGVLAFLPKTAEHLSNWLQVSWPTGPSDVKINEFLARNDAVIQDPAGEWDDYVELYNTSSAPASVGGLYLTDNLLNPTKFMIPLGTTIPANETLLIWCDEDGSQGPLHANFKLSADGETISLFDTGGITQLDTFAFGPQIADVSTGRLLDGGAPWVTFPAPTPEARNELPGCGVRAYSAQDFASHTMTLGLTASPAIGTTFAFAAAGGPPSGFGALGISVTPIHAEVPGATITALVSLDPPTIFLPVVLDAAGAWTFPVTLANNPALVGAQAYMQVAVIGATSYVASQAVEAVICP